MKTLRIFTFIAVAALAATVNTGSLMADGGVLIGLSKSKAADGVRYASWYVTFDQNGAALKGTYRGVIVPHKTTFLSIDVEHKEEGKVFSEDFIVVSDLTRKKTWRSKGYCFPSEGSEECTVSRVLLFAGPSYFSYDEVGGGYYEGAAHPWASSALVTLKLPDPRSSSVAFTELFPSAQQANVKAKVLKVADKSWKTSSDKDCLSPDYNFTMFGFIRRKGGWATSGQLGYDNEACRSSYLNFPIPVKPQKNVVAHDALPLKFSAIKKKYPQAVDAIASPDGKSLVIITKKQIILLADGLKSKGAKSKVTLPKPPGAFIVSHQWSGGKYVETWRATLDKIAVKLAK